MKRSQHHQPLRSTRSTRSARSARPSRTNARGQALLRAQLALGLPLINAVELAGHAPRVANRAVRAMSRVPAGGACFVCGPSGAGKSTHLRQFVSQIAADRGTVLELMHTPSTRRASHAGDLRLIELGAGLSLHRWLTILAHVGLAEAGLFARRLSELSDGQMHRAKVAMLLAKAERLRRRRQGRAARTRGAADAGVWIVADELTSGLDRQTAVALAAGLARYVAASAASADALRLLVAAHDPALGEALRADVEILCRLNAPATVLIRQRRREKRLVIGNR